MPIPRPLATPSMLQNGVNSKAIRHTTCECYKTMPIPRPLATPPILQNFANSNVIIHITNVTN